MLSSMMMANSQILSATLLIVAGVYPRTPWKMVCFWNIIDLLPSDECHRLR